MDKWAYKTCEKIGGYVDNNFCIIRRIYLKTVNLDDKEIVGDLETIGKYRTENIIAFELKD